MPPDDGPAPRSPASERDGALRPQDTVAVVGLGLLGRGIAACLLAHGYRVVAVERRDERRDEARREIGVAMRDLVDRAGFPSALPDEWSGRYLDTDSVDEAIAAAAVVVESIDEDPVAKSRVFDEIEAVVSPRAPVASNTSAIPIAVLQQGRKHPERFIGMHWAEPAHATRFLEIIRGELTDDATTARIEELGRSLGKSPCVVARDVPGFIVNRLAYAMYREALHLLTTGVADAETIDRAFRNGCGLWATFCGPLRWIDLTGGPELYARAMERVLPDLDTSSGLSPVIRALQQAGARGMDSGFGFYTYSEEEAARWKERFREHSWTVRSLHEEYTRDETP